MGSILWQKYTPSIVDALQPFRVNSGPGYGVFRPNETQSRFCIESRIVGNGTTIMQGNLIILTSRELILITTYSNQNARMVNIEDVQEIQIIDEK